MKRSLELAEKLIHQSYLEKEEYMELLGSYQDKETVVCLGQEAARLREKYYGNKVYMRGLIEFTNFCKNNCYYCCRPCLRPFQHFLQTRPTSSREEEPEL